MRIFTVVGKAFLLQLFLFYLLRKPADLLAALVVVVSVVVVVGGEELVRGVWGIHVWSLFFWGGGNIFFNIMYGSNAHVWSREGVTPHSEIIV